MRLRYIKANEHTVIFGNEKTQEIEHTCVFSPECDVPDKYVERLLNNPALKGRFQKIEPKVPQAERVAAVCGICQKPFKSRQGLMAHESKMHKEKT